LWSSREQLPLQQSAFVVHATSCGAQSVSSHTPLWQPVEQQSSALVHAAPFGKQ